MNVFHVKLHCHVIISILSVDRTRSLLWAVPVLEEDKEWPLFWRSVESLK